MNIITFSIFWCKNSTHSFKFWPLGLHNKRNKTGIIDNLAKPFSPFYSQACVMMYIFETPGQSQLFQVHTSTFHSSSTFLSKIEKKIKYFKFFVYDSWMVSELSKFSKRSHNLLNECHTLFTWYTHINLFLMSFSFPCLIKNKQNYGKWGLYLKISSLHVNQFIRIQFSP